MSLMVGASLQAEDNHLYIQPNAGETLDWNITSLQNMSFSNGNVVLHTKAGTSATTPIASINRMYVTTPSAQGIEQTKENLPYQWDGKTLQMDAHPGTVVEVFNVSGTLVVRKALSSNMTVDLSDLGQGMYIVRTNGHAFKIIKK